MKTPYRLPLPFAALLLGVLIPGGDCRAQTSSGVITGRVIDPQGGSVPGAPVLLTEELTAVKLTTKTDSAGDFLFPSVLPGRYSVTVQAQGFKRFEKKGLTLAVFERLSTGTLELQVGGISESVTVNADATPVNTASSEGSAVVGQQQLSSLPDQGRAYTTLLTTLPGVVWLTSSEGQGTLGGSTLRLPLVNGLRREENSVTVDGVTASTRGYGETENIPNLDAIAEVKILINNYQAEYGKTPGAAINVVTKGGAAQFHATAYWAKRHEMFDANSFFNNRVGAPKGRDRYDTVGYNVGGPAYWPGKVNRNRNKLFFLFSQEIILANAASTRNFTVPTPLELQGNFSQSVLTNGNPYVVKDPLTGQPFPGNIVPAARINPNMQKLLSVFPSPDFLNTAVSGRQYNYVISDSTGNPAHQELVRMDYDPSEKWRFYFRGLDQFMTNQGRVTAANFNNWGIVQPHASQAPAASLSATYIATPTLVNDLNFGFGQWDERQPLNLPNGDAAIEKDKLGITLWQGNPQNNPLNVLPAVSFGLPNAATISYDGRFPLGDRSSVMSLADGLTKIAGPHTLKAGLYLEYQGYLMRNNGGANFPGAFDFSINANNPVDTGYPYATALLGYFNTYSELATARPDLQPIRRAVEWYAQDSWKVNRRLTLDYGVRFAYDLKVYDKTNVGGDFEPAIYNRSQAAALYVPAKNTQGVRVAENPLTGAFYPVAYIGLFVPGSRQYFDGSVAAGASGYPRGFANGNGVLLAPRFGFAYDPFGDGKTAIRGGAGIFHSGRPDAGASSSNPPAVYSQTQYYGNVSTFSTAGALVSPASVSVISGQEKNPSIYQMSLDIQRSLAFGAIIDVGYVGNMGRHLAATRQINGVPYGAEFLPQNQDPTTGTPLPDNFFRPTYGYGAMNLLDFSGSSNFNSLQTQIRRRFFHNLQISGVWTWGKAMSLGTQGTGSSNAATSTLAEFAGRRFWNYGPDPWDRTHNLVGNWVWDLPKASSLVNRSAVRWILDDWQIAGICSFVSGTPVGVTMTLSDGANLVGGGDGVTVLKTGNAVLPKDQRTFTEFFNTAVFARPAVGNLGSGAGASIYAFRGPGINNWNVTFKKSIRLKDKVALQVRWEMYNAFNHTQFNAVNSTAVFNAQGAQTSSTFGQLTGADSPRIQQMTLRLTY
jgi:hypothetical protein